MKKLYIIICFILFSQFTKAVDFTIELIPSTNSIGDSQLSAISISKVTNLQSILDSKADQSSVTSSLALKADNSSLRKDNLIINGSFILNQRGYISNTSLSAYNYAHDRWRSGTSGVQYSFTQLSSSTQINITSGTLRQTVEDYNIIGGSYTLSWVGTAQCSLKTGRSPAPIFNSSPITLSGVSSGTELTVECNSGTLSLVQLNEGSNSSPFSLAGKNINGEIALAQRYYEKSYNFFTPLKTSTGIGAFLMRTRSTVSPGSPEHMVFTVFFKQTKRDVPSIVTYSVSSPISDNTFCIHDSISDACGYSFGSLTGGGGITSGTNSFSLNATHTQLNGIRFHWSADSELFDFFL